MTNWKILLVAMISGFLAALVVDLNAWSKWKATDPKFDWLLAFKRWVAGAVSGLTVALAGGVATGGGY